MSRDKTSKHPHQKMENFECKNVFLLDASVFPDVPGSPTTFNIAINSSRIISNLISEKDLILKILILGSSSYLVKFFLKEISNSQIKPDIFQKI